MPRAPARPRRPALPTARWRCRPGSQWRLDNFSQESYRKLYEKLRTSALRVDTYSDLDTLPNTPNVTLTRLR